MQATVGMEERKAKAAWRLRWRVSAHVTLTLRPTEFRHFTLLQFTHIEPRSIATATAALSVLTSEDSFISRYHFLSHRGFIGEPKGDNDRCGPQQFSNRKAINADRKRAAQFDCVSRICHVQRSGPFTGGENQN